MPNNVAYNQPNKLIQIDQWGENEVRIELAGNGHYVPRKSVENWIKKHAFEISLEMTRNWK
jgi:hypothetical protein